LGTDDPLQFHNTNAPLLEEYAVAGHFFELTGTDKCEIARNSVLVSGFEHYWKKKWLGKSYYLKNNVLANDQDCTNISQIRAHYRHTNLLRELSYIAKLSGMKSETTTLKNGISYLSLAGHTFPDPSCLQNLMKKMNNLQRKYEELIMADNITTQKETALSLKQLTKDMSASLSTLESETTDSNGETKTSLTTQSTASSTNEDVFVELKSVPTSLKVSSAAELDGGSSNLRKLKYLGSTNHLKSSTADYF
jgi:paraquat-inducible protein B